VAVGSVEHLPADGETENIAIEVARALEVGDVQSYVPRGESASGCGRV
jgi:hypothetical protein